MKVIVISTPESAPFETAPSSDILRSSAILPSSATMFIYFKNCFFCSRIRISAASFTSRQNPFQKFPLH